MARNFIILDTETAPTINHADGNAHPETSLFYDFGFIVVDGNTGETLASYSFINSDVFFNDQYMNSAYYAWKRPRYYDGMGTAWTVANTRTIYKTFVDACKRFKVRKVWAFNCRFDKLTCNNTLNHYSNGFISDLLPDGVEWADIWDYAGSTICNTSKYVKWCKFNGYVSEKGNPRTNAETIYRYLSNDLLFNEEHTALSDCDIELAILQAAKRRKQKARHSIGQGWRDAAKIARA